ncbi:MAG: acyl-CoA synthetase [Jatrophihabitans sp.]|uniref:acyl-CoA synthetase n=1 Tax=Jatrophihabitans sp. TaxID=1932789 RepID=UPI003F807AA6
MANYVRDFVATRPRDERALVVDGGRPWTFGELTDAAGSVARAFADRGVRRGDVVLTLLGNGIEYALTMLACLHLGAPMLPCSEQLRAKDVALRVRRAVPRLIVADERNRAVVEAALAETGAACATWFVPDESFLAPHDAPPYAELDDVDPSFVLFTSGTTGEPKLVTHGQRYVWGQTLQAREWMAARPGELVWSTAAPGWSKSARNSFLAPWWCGAAALLQDERFDPARRLETIRRHRVDVLCMAPTEYRLIAAAGPIDVGQSLRRMITAGEALGVPVVQAWREQTGLEIADGYGQTETGQVTGVRPDESAPPGSMGRPLPGVRAEIIDGELCVDPATVPTFFLGYDGDPAPDGWWHTGDQVRQDASGWLFFESRADDVIISAGYRIGPAEVESVLLAHPAVREVAVIGVPDDARGHAVAAVVVLRDGYAPSDGLTRELQAHAKAETAPYKYPRVVRYVDTLPKTTSGKINRVALRSG